MILPLTPPDATQRAWLAPLLALLLGCGGVAARGALDGPLRLELAERYLVLNPRCEWPAALGHLAAPALSNQWALGVLALWALGAALEQEGRAVLTSVIALSTGAAALVGVAVSGLWLGPCGLVAGLAGAVLALSPRRSLRCALWLPLLLLPLPLVGGPLALAAWLYCWTSLRREAPSEGSLARALGWVSVSAPAWLGASLALLGALACSQSAAAVAAGGAAGLGLGWAWARHAARQVGARRPSPAPFERSELLVARQRPRDQRPLQSFSSWQRARAARRG